MMSDNCSCFCINLYQTNNGNVSMSKCGNHYKIVYNNIVICQNEAGFRRFLSYVTDCKAYYANEPDINKRDIFFSTNDQAVLFVFSPIEVNELHYLLETSFIESQLYAAVHL